MRDDGTVTSDQLVVHCLSGHSYADHPLSFEWNGEHYVVARTESTRRVLDNASGIVVSQFIVETAAARRFRLSYDETADTWTVEPM